MDIRIRAAGRGDMDVVWRATMETVWNDLPAEERATMDRAAFERHFRPHAARIVESKEHAVFVAEGPDRAVVGYAIVGGASSMLSPVPFGFLYDLWVEPRARRQGVGRRLLVRAEEWCRERGFRSLRLEVSAPNVAARALYASSGMREERLFLGKPLDRVSNPGGNV